MTCLARVPWPWQAAHGLRYKNNIVVQTFEATKRGHGQVMVFLMCLSQEPMHRQSDTWVLLFRGRWITVTGLRWNKVGLVWPIDQEGQGIFLVHPEDDLTAATEAANPRVQPVGGAPVVNPGPVGGASVVNPGLAAPPGQGILGVAQARNDTLRQPLQGSLQYHPDSAQTQRWSTQGTHVDIQAQRPQQTQQCSTQGTHPLGSFTLAQQQDSLRGPQPLQLYAISHHDRLIQKEAASARACCSGPYFGGTRTCFCRKTQQCRRPRNPCSCGRLAFGRTCIIDTRLASDRSLSTCSIASRFVWSCLPCCQWKHAAIARSGSKRLPGRLSGQRSVW
jgi:hypothetical protein